MSIDKPPLGFWLQAASAKIFGFTPFSIFLPQALAGVLSVVVLYHLVQRHFGVVAGLLAALALAISPISVVTNRNNTIDSTLVLVMLLGAWAVLRAAETGKLRWLLLCAVFVGLGFNIKMLEAYLVVPAYGLLYLLALVGAPSPETSRGQGRAARVNYRRVLGMVVMAAVAAAVCLIRAILACCGSSTSRWAGKSCGSCRWPCWEYSPWPGSAARASGRIDSSTH